MYDLGGVMLKCVNGVCRAKPGVARICDGASSGVGGGAGVLT